MKFPVMNRQRTNTVRIPKLSGGVNFRDSVTLIRDNQLTDCKNVWYKDGVLKTRPGINATVEGSECIINFGNNVKLCRNENATKVIDGERCTLVSFVKVNEEINCIINFVWIDGKGKIKENAGQVCVEHSSVADALENFFVVQLSGKLYCFVKTIFQYLIFKNNDNNIWIQQKELPDNESDNDYIYIPTIITNCKGGTFNASLETLKDAGGVMIDGYNLLSPYYKIIYSSVNREMLDTSNTDSKHAMIYVLLHNARKFVGKEVIVKLTNNNGDVIIHRVTVTGAVQDFESSAPQPHDDGKRLMVFGGKIGFVDVNNQLEYIWVGENDYIENNMEVIAPCSNSCENLEKVFCMTKNISFGGDALGISGGTRLFLGGNIKEKEESLVIWSGLNEPTYFSENCYAYVGDSTQKITAFGRQNDSLIIFKEKETFCTQYVQNSNISAEDLINQTIVDYTASSVYFPMIQVHSNIGCDCPGTVQLCRNYLVWMCSDGSVYTLRSENQYSERNIYCVSEMIESRLKKYTKEELQNSKSTDFEGHYFVFVGDEAFVMDYNSYGYVNIASYNKSEDAQLLIPWWIWEFPVNIDFSNSDKLYKGMVVCGNTPVFLYDFLVDKTANDGPQYACFTAIPDFDANEDNIGCQNTKNNVFPIKTCLTTKIFDFDAPHRMKNVPAINISFGNNGGNPIEVSFVSDSGIDENEVVIIDESNSDEHSSDLVHNRWFRPSTQLISRLGVRLECEGEMSVDSISLDYKLLGGAR